jgi:EpsI family protein
MLDSTSGNRRRAVLASIGLGLLMVSSAAVTKVLTPTTKLSAGKPAFDLNALVPADFGDWKEDRTLVSAVVNPQTEAAMNAIYSQTLSRTYVSKAGERIMLSIAYGDDQGGEGTQAHRPEICYAAQGFGISSNNVGVLTTGERKIPVRRLVASNGPRNEPITYWVTVGDQATLPGIGRKLTQLAYGLGGQVPDGLLFRVSSIQRDNATGFALQDKFVNDLFSSLDANQQVRLAGKIQGS